ncbi:MAG: succinate--CoA ligase subunit alpha [Thermoprotei archaeon]|nr:MAG: succinate--CoA ligase subunit alpha [Thermoprotei archaeon]
MAIIIDKNTRLLVQGITGKEGSFHTKLMLEYGTKVVAGVTPGKEGQQVHGVPVYNTIKKALKKHPEINTSIIFVPARFTMDAVYEAIDAGIEKIIVITEGVPLWDELMFVTHARRHGVVIVGPNTPGVISPGKAKVGIMPGHVFKEGSIGVVSRSGTLTYEISREIVRVGFGESTVIGIGGDPVTGLDFIDVYKMFLEDPETNAIVIIGEIGGDAEERLAHYIRKHGLEKPVIAYVAGMTAPPGKRMGHAGAIISMGMGDWASKKRAFEDVGVPVARTPWEIGELLRKYLVK